MKKMIALSIFGLLIVSQAGFTAASKDTRAAGWLTVTPTSIEFPAYTKPSTGATFVLTLKNAGPITITVPYVTVHEDSAKPSATSGWLGYGTLPGDILPGDSATMLLVLNDNGVVTSGPTQLFGKLRLYYGPTGDSLDLPITFTVADSIAFPSWDTLTTACNQNIAVGTNGNLGENSAGFVNLNFLPFTQGGVECDTGLNGRGNAAIYLADASPVIIRHPLFWSIHRLLVNLRKRPRFTKRVTPAGQWHATPPCHPERVSRQL